ncbi:hypothetical protein [Flavobacterium sangjuense]|uniref:MukB N-terminal domain-containing protein n=1 Tax=Flavobacterium sangjuense TaxID=2518177 RepID=A0A4P7PV52_9FLAO|nr:hypothetical protein [Flavobacterium sangjuense]QBZ98877.1 hypothetical protein GS03_02389 [Flavobacterium sangjuense]
MNYPKIYSLSTVGIVKHYNQDYLFHPERTDFTGNNGVGKSILADLIQLIFISDDHLIEFGTESMDKEGRSAYTLPKDTNEAYAFMNIEVEKDAFVTIGVCIPNKRSKRLKPFIILKDLNLDKSIEQLSFPATKLPSHKTFIHEGQFLGIEELTRHFRDRHSLCLQYFVHNEDKDRYYSFLYKKEILSINLSIKSNLKSFAKIIQSFSRAKSLNIKNSQNLKDFLFEESEKDYHEMFAIHKTELEKQLFDYKNLESEIAQLEGKQLLLAELKQMEERAKVSHLAYLGYCIRFGEKHIKTLQLKHDSGQQILLSYQEELQNLEKRSPRLKAVLYQMEDDITKLKKTNLALRKFMEYQQSIDNLVIERDKLANCKAPDVGQIEKNGISINEFHTEELLKRIEEFKVVFDKYHSLKAMNDKVTQQKKIIQDCQNDFCQEIKRNKEILALIKHNKKDSLFSKVLEQNQPLTEMQEAVLFHLLSTSWGKPKDPQNLDDYTENLDLISENNITTDNLALGYWLKTGHLNRFIPKLNQSPLLNDPGKLAEAFAKRQAEIESVISGHERQLLELEKFEKGQSFDKKIIQNDYQLDSQLKDYTAFQQFERTAQLIANLGIRIETITAEINQLKEKQDELKLSAQITERGNSDYYDKWIEIKTNNITFCMTQIAKEESRIMSLKDELIPIKISANEGDHKNLEIAVEKYDSTWLDFYKIYTDEDFSTTDYLVISAQEETETFADSYRKLWGNYTSEYKLTASKFDDAANSNIEIKEQIRDEKFSFHFLEQALLGPKIKYLDNIGENVRELNRVRLSIVDAIFETMLKIFMQTKDKYEHYRKTVRDLNTFFKGTKISKKHYFQIHFVQQKDFSIDWIYQLQNYSTAAHKTGELPFSDITVEDFVEDFFRKATGYRRKINFGELLDPKTYFNLEAKLENENGDKETPGSTGETYAAVVLLGIGRLSKVQTSTRKGLRFIILEETANLDATNFSTFPDLAKEHGYQIITMTPKPYGSVSDGSWILHHLIPGLEDNDINFPISNSYFKTNTDSTSLDQFLTNSLL